MAFASREIMEFRILKVEQGGRGSLAWLALITVCFEVFRSWIMAVVLGLAKFGSAMRDEIVHIKTTNFFI